MCNRILTQYSNGTCFKIYIFFNICLLDHMLFQIRSRKYCLLYCSWKVPIFPKLAQGGKSILIYIQYTMNFPELS